METAVRLHPIDWIFIVGYCIVAFLIGTIFMKRAGKDIAEFFIAGRTLPWWLAGTSIVATSFACDTPLAISGLIRSQGIYANWFWWNLVVGGMICTFFYARLWRRAHVTTDIEFIEMRYGGWPASILRVFMALYSGILYNCIVMGWVMLAMVKICEVMLGWEKVFSLTVLVLIALAYTVMSGFWGVVMTDFIQFILAMTGSIALAVIVLMKTGGPTNLVQMAQDAEGFRPEIFKFVPDWATAGKLAVITFAVQLTIQWWPQGQGYGYVAQRLFSCKNERHSVLASLWFNYACYALRPWPWIIVGIASIIYFPITSGEDAEMMYPRMIAEFMPVGLRGLMVASLLAAFMSTIDTQLNWGASYLVNDVYKRFIVRKAPPEHYVLVSRISVIALMITAAVATHYYDSIRGAWFYLAVLMSGSGLVLLLRWYWWRVNAWSEITALVCTFILANGKIWLTPFFRFLPEGYEEKILWFYGGEAYAVRLAVITLVVTVIWVTVTFLTRPVAPTRLAKFYRRVRPSGWWGPVAEACPEVRPEPARNGWLGWLFGMICIYTGLFGLGYLCLGQYLWGTLLVGISLIMVFLTVAQVPADTPAENDASSES